MINVTIFQKDLTRFAEAAQEACNVVGNKLLPLSVRFQAACMLATLSDARVALMTGQKSVGDDQSDQLSKTILASFTEARDILPALLHLIPQEENLTRLEREERFAVVPLAHQNLLKYMEQQTAQPVALEAAA